MIGYVTLGTNDIARAARFYDALLADLGAKRAMETDSFIAWASSPERADAVRHQALRQEARHRGQRRDGLAGRERQAAGRRDPPQGARAGCQGRRRARAPRRRLLRRLLPGPRRQQAERVLHGLVAEGVVRPSASRPSRRSSPSRMVSGCGGHPGM